MDILKDLDDLEFNSDDENSEDEKIENNGEEGDSQIDEDDGDDNSNVDDMDEEGKTNELIPSDLIKMVSAKLASNIGSFRKSLKYQNQLQSISKFLSGNSNDASKLSSLQANEEYQLILDCNKFIHDLDDELSETHRYVVEMYAKKFPELESLIPNKIDYVRTILRIKNETDMTLVDLNDILSAASVMVVSVTGSTTTGQVLSEKNLSLVLNACEEVLQLHQDKLIVLQFIESRMSTLAPGICALVGSRLCAQLVGLAGGVVALSKIPACNVEVMGQEKRHLAGTPARSV